MATAAMTADQRRADVTAASATPGAHISTSGGVFTQSFVESLMQPTFNHPALLPESFATPFDPAPTPRELEDQMGLVFELVVEQWDKIRASFNGMSVSDVRERWLRHLFSGLDFRWIYQRADTVLGADDDLRFSLSHRGWPEAGAPIIHTVAPSQDLDARTPGQRGMKGKSPHDMVQAYLNAAPDDRWAILTNGRFLRILRKYHHVYSKGYVEFDLEGICESRASADWRALYRLAHASRFWVREGSDGAEGRRPLDRLYDDSVATGVKVGEQLQGNVRRAIQYLATGFLDAATLERLRGDEEATRAFYAETLHVVYRLLFLLYAEQRGMLPGRTTLYAQEYSIARLRERVTRACPATDAHSDLWEGLKATFRMVATGVPRLGIFGYNGELFSETRTPTLNALACRNGWLLQAIRELTFTHKDGALQSVNYADVGVEEIGAVYESLLEYAPRVTTAAEVVEIEKRKETVPANSFYLDPRGTSRKTSGSYYTRPELVAELIKSALKPVLEERLAGAGADPQAREAALLALRVVDPACGSGAFLIAATDYLGRELARIRTGDDYPADRDLRRARRDVLMRCVYGVDLNPMAVELAKVSLWINSAVEDLPLNFLDHHIKRGNSLIGATPALLEAGVPDDAFEPVTGDDKSVAKSLKARNRQQRELWAKGHAQSMLPFDTSAPLLGNLPAEYARLGAMPEDTPEQVHAKREAYERLVRQMGYEHSGHFYADAWLAAFFWPLDADHAGDAPTFAEVKRIEQSPYSASIFLKSEVRRLREEYRFFHWHLEFPDVFAGEDPGFDCVLGNPPWERIKLQEEEFFGPRAPEIAAAPNAAARKKMIAGLPATRPDLYEAYTAALRRADGQSKYYRESGRYPLTARGDINVYSIFAESDRGLIASHGRAGIIVPTGIATDDTNKDFFGDVATHRALASLYDFENRAPMFPAVDSRYKFSLLTMAGDGRGPERADLLCFALRPDDLRDEQRHFTLSPADFALINPNTRTLPIFRSSRDADLTRQMYRAAPVLVDESDPDPGSPWGIKFGTMFHMSNDSSFFRTQAELEAAGYTLDGAGVFRAAGLAVETAPGGPTATKPAFAGSGTGDYLPLYEAKLFHQYDHRFATFAGGPGEDKARDTTDAEHADPTYAPLPRYWVPADEVEHALGGWQTPWMLLFRDITNATNERTWISSVTPRVGVGNNAPLLLLDSRYQQQGLCILSNLNSLPFDYVTRQKAGGTHLNFFIVKQLPVLPPSIYERRLESGERLAEWVTRRALELSYTSWSLRPLARDLGYDGSPFAWDEGRRARLRGELDGMYAHLYGLSRDDFAYILTTFPVLEKNERRTYGEYRTARLALAAYDALAGMIEMAG